jgi:hypothetical protein
MMCETTTSASWNLASVSVVFLFVLLLLAALPLPGVRRGVLVLSGILLRVTLLVTVVTLGVWALVPASEPASVSDAIRPMVTRAAGAVQCEPDLVRPFIHLWIAANVLVGGIVLIAIVNFARLLAIHHRHLSQLLHPTSTPPMRSVAARPRKKLADLL